MIFFIYVAANLQYSTFFFLALLYLVLVILWIFAITLLSLAFVLQVLWCFSLVTLLRLSTYVASTISTHLCYSFLILLLFSPFIYSHFLLASFFFCLLSIPSYFQLPFSFYLTHPFHQYIILFFATHHSIYFTFVFASPIHLHLVLLHWIISTSAISRSPLII